MDNIQIEILDSTNSIEGVLDVGDVKNFSMSLTSSIANLKDISERSGSFSTSFKVPSTKNNDDVLEHIYLSQHKNYKDFDAEKDARIRINGVTLESGRLQITRMSRVAKADSYSFKFFGNNMDWVLKMRGKTTQDLPYLDTSLTYDDSTVSGSWSNVGGSDLPVFSIINRGQREVVNQVNVKDTFPDYFVTDYLNNAFKSVGYNFSSTFFNTSAQKQLIIPFFGDNFRDTARSELNEAIVQLDSSATNFDNTFTTAAGYYTNILDLNPLISTSSFGDDLRINFQANTFSTHSASTGGGIQATGSTKSADFDDTPAPLKDDNSNYASNVYTVRYDNRYRVTCNMDFTFTRDPNQQQLNPDIKHYIKLTRGSNVSYFQMVSIANQGNLTVTSVSGTREELRYVRRLESAWFNCQAGDELEIVYSCAVRRGLGNYTASSYYMKLTHAQVPIHFEPYPYLDEGDEFNWKTVSDDTIDLLDIVTDIGRLFHIYWRTDVVTKTVYAEPRDDFYNALSTATNETDRIDPSKQIEIYYNSQFYNRKHDFKYVEDSKDGYLKEHNDNDIDEWCSYEHNYPAKFKEGTTELKTKVIAATHYLEDVYAGSTIPMITARMWNDPVQLKPILSNVRGMKPRILYYNYSTQQDIEGNSRDFNWRGESSNRTTIPYALPFPIIEENITLADVDGELTFKEVAGSDGLWVDYFKNTAAEIRDGKRITLYLKTDLVDYRSLDFRKVFYFDNRYPEVEGYWRIEKVSGFLPNGKNISCKYDLIQAKVFNAENHAETRDTTDILIGSPINTGIENGNDSPSANRTSSTGSGNRTPDNGNLIFGNNLETDGTGVMRVGVNNLDVSTDLFQLGMGTPDEPFSLIRQTATGEIYFNGQLLNPDNGFGGAVIDVTSDITVDGSVDTCLIDATGGDITVTLNSSIPEAHTINMKRMDASGNTVTIVGDADGMGSILPIDDDTAGFTILSQYDNVPVKKIDNNEFIII